MIVAGNVIAQDLQPILDAVNKLDSRLKAAIEKEAQVRADEIWGHRHVEKTILEREHILTPSDLAATAQFGFGKDAKHGVFNLSVLNGTSYAHVSEENGRKDVNAVLYTRPLQTVPALKKSAVTAQVYYGTQNESLEDIVAIDTTGPTPDTTIFDVNLITLGDGPGHVNLSQRATSFFTTLHIREFVSEKSELHHLSLFAGRDFYDPDTETDRDDLTATIIGIESAPLKGFKIAHRVDTFDNDALADQGQLYVNTLYKF